jgi:hypothetical protein
MEHEGSLLYSQEPTTGPFIEPDASSSNLHTPFLLRFVQILLSHLCLGLPSGFFLSVFRLK